MKPKFLLVACAFAIVLGMPDRFWLAPSWGQRTAEKTVRGTKAATAPPAAAKEPAMPFHVGETLNYRVGWASFSTAALLEVSIPERRNLFGWSTWHFRAALHTQSPVRSLFAIDDEFDSYADASALDTRRYEAYQNELGRKEDRVLDFLTAGQKPWGHGPDVVVLEGTRDPVGALYALRGVNWQQGSEFRVPVYDGRDIYQLSAKLEAKSDPIGVAAGNFTALRVVVNLSQNNKRSPDITFKVWLANDATRTPVQFQANMPFGSIHAELLADKK